MKHILTFYLCVMAHLVMAQESWTINTGMFRLDNGLTVVTLENRNVNNITAELYFRAGFRYEKKGEYGFAHLMEHSLRPVRIFKKDQNWPEYAKVFVRSNAQTRNDYTRYHQQVKSNGLEQVLAALSDRAQMPIDSLDEKRITGNIMTVINELSSPSFGKWYYDDYIYKRIKENIYGQDHPYGHVQNVDDIKAATPSKIQDWYIDHHNANQAYLLLSGNIDTLEVKPLVEKYFGNIGFEKNSTIVNVDIPVREAIKSETIHFEGDKAAIVDFWTIPEWGSFDGEILRFLHGYVKKKLEYQLKKRGVDGTVFGAVRLYELTGQFSMGVEFGNFGQKELYNSILTDVVQNIQMDSLEAYKKEFFFEEELLMEDYGFGSHKNRMVMEGAIFKGNPKRYFTNLDRLGQLTKESVLRVMDRWLLQKRPYRLIIDNRTLSKKEGDIDHGTMPKVNGEHAVVYPNVVSFMDKDGPQVHFLESKNGPTKLTFTFDPLATFSSPGSVEAFHRKLKLVLKSPYRVNYHVSHGFPIVEIDFLKKNSSGTIAAIIKSLKSMDTFATSMKQTIKTIDDVFPDLTTPSNGKNRFTQQIRSLSLIGNPGSAIREQVQDIGSNGMESLVIIEKDRLGEILHDNGRSNSTNMQGRLFFRDTGPVDIITMLLLEELLEVRLNKLLRTENRWTYYVEVEAVVLDKSTFSINIQSALDDVPMYELEAFIREDMKVGQWEFTPEEIVDAKTYLKGGILRMMDNISGQSELLNLLGTEHSFIHILDVVDQIDTLDLLNALKNYLGSVYKI